jgi:hypothetical protein
VKREKKEKSWHNKSNRPVGSFFFRNPLFPKYFSPFRILFPLPKGLLFFRFHRHRGLPENKSAAFLLPKALPCPKRIFSLVPPFFSFNGFFSFPGKMGFMGSGQHFTF